jgi:geranylgeranyl diphosphate synthase type I
VETTAPVAEPTIYHGNDSITTADAAGALAAAGTLHIEIGDGWDPADELDAMCRYAVLPPGKLFRPYLLLESCAAVGGDLHVAVPAALGAEYGHVASLVHDDIIDNDMMRRGRASVPAEYGRDHAIIVGDTLIFRLFLALAECAERGAPATRVVASLRAVAVAGVDLCRGQTADGRLRRGVEVDLDDYCQTVRGKTGALFRGACEVGALLGGGGDGQVAALATYGEQLGIAFQMADDLLAYRSTTRAAGKDLLSDLRNRQMTFPLVVAGMIAGERVRKVLPVLFDQADAAHRASVGGQDVLGAVRELLDSVSALDEAAKIVQRHAEDALTALDFLPPSASHDRLAATVSAAVDRVA